MIRALWERAGGEEAAVRMAAANSRWNLCSTAHHPPVQNALAHDVQRAKGLFVHLQDPGGVSMLRLKCLMNQVPSTETRTDRGGRIADGGRVACNYIQCGLRDRGMM